MKIIFLDIDGVLNAGRSTYPNDNIETNEGRLNEVLVSRLNRLIENTEAKVVISSTWRIGSTVQKIKHALEEAGFDGEIIGMTPTSSHGVRGVEIMEWCRENENVIENYIIIDDDSDMLLWQAPHFFNTDTEYGLTDKIVYKASRFLNGVLI